MSSRLLHDLTDQRISELKEDLGRLRQWRERLEEFEFHRCKEHGCYGIHKGDKNICKMCKRLGLI